MFGVALAVLLGLVLVAILRRAGELGRGSLLPPVLLSGYVLRLVLQAFVRDLDFFSHASNGGDSVTYETYGQLIALTWRHSAIHFITQDDFPEMGPTALPPNVFALVIYLNDGLTRLGCTAVVALAAALTVLNVYKLGIQFGARERDALLVATLLYFDPAFLHYTSDTFKDGLVVCFTTGALASAVRLTFKVSALHAAIGAVCAVALWHVRFYLVFVTTAPLVVGLSGVGSRTLTRPILVALLLAAGGLALVGFTDFLQLASDRASETFELAVSRGVLESNASGGSGVEFDDGGSPFRALLPKLAYTLFSPFLWARGSLGFQVAKLDSLVWYFLIYRAARAARSADPRLLLALLTFVVPCTLMYAMSMANVGLIVRQRMVIVAATGVLATLGGRVATAVRPALAATVAR